MALLFPKKQRNPAAPGWHPVRLTTHMLYPADAFAGLFTREFMLRVSRKAKAERLAMQAVTQGNERTKRDMGRIPKKSLANKVFSRVAAITGLPKQRLLPRVYSDPHTYNSSYSPATHELKVGKIEEVNHELLHATEALLTDLPPRPFIRYGREMEPSANVDSRRKITGTSGLPAATTSIASLGLTLAHHPGTAIVTVALGGAFIGIDAARVLMVKKAIRKYGTDGWIALRAHGAFDPLFAGAVLRSLEKRGFLTQRGFTLKGETRIRSLKPEIEARLEKMEARRRRLV